MFVREIKVRAKRVFFGRYIELASMITSAVIIILLIKIIELSSAYIMLSKNIVTSQELIFPVSGKWNIIKILFYILEFILLVPSAAAITKFLHFTVTGKNTDYNRFLFNLKASIIWLTAKLISFVFFFPSAFCVYISLKYFSEAYNNIKGEAYLIISFYSFIFSVIFFIIHIYIISGMFLVPFIFAEYPEKNPFSVISESFRSMKGMRKKLIRLTLGFCFRAVTALLIVTIPYTAAHLLSWYSILADSILHGGQVKEYEEI